MEIFVDQGYKVLDDLVTKYKIFNYKSYDARVALAPFDLNIYEMGNNTFHIYLYKQALRIPGLVVQHDLSLSYILYHYLVGITGNYMSFVKELQYSEGGEAASSFASAYNAGNEDKLMSFFSQHYMLKRLSERSIAFVTHLEYCANTIREKYGANNVYSMYLGSPDPFEEYPHIDRSTARQVLEISNDTFVIGVFGFLQPTKQIDVVIKAVEKAARDHDDILLVFVGELNTSGGYDQLIIDLVKRLKLTERVRFTGYTSNEIMQNYYVAVDVVVNLRYPSFGEMSATLSRGIATGKPVIVTDLPEWRFLPESFCWFVPASDLRGDSLAAWIGELIANPELIKQRGEVARQFYLSEGTTERAATNLASIVDSVTSIRHGIEPIYEDMLSKLEFDLSEQLPEKAFNEWDVTRAGGWRRYQIQKVRAIPIVGSVIWAGYRALENILSIPRLRKAEWRMFRTFADEIKNASVRVQQNSNAVEQIKNDFTSVYELPQHRFIEDFDQLLPAMDFRRKKREMSEDEYYKVFQDVFRGSEQVIKQRQAKIVSHIAETIPDAALPFVDIGCGRGEFIDLLKESGLRPIGVEINAEEVKTLKARGHEVYLDTGKGYLSRLAPESISGVSAFHLLEHLSEDEALELLELAWDKLIVGGLVYVETPNPLNSQSYSSFYTDPTHVRPIQPFQMAFWLKVTGFCEIDAFFQEPVTAFGSISEQKWITFYQDYGLIAKKCR